MQALVNFVIALPSEAKPLINRLGLRQDSSRPDVRLYTRNQYRLLVSGIGKAASATAVRTIVGSEPSDTHHIWLNVGIAGHAHLPKGAPGIAHLITDATTGVSFCPSIAFEPPCPTYALACYDKPTTAYAGDAMCDMESSAFFSAASQFSGAEFVHALKIVSDNSAADIEALDRTAIGLLIENNLDIVTSLAETLERIHARRPP